METKTLTLTEFLLARIAEDEADAKVEARDDTPRRIGPPFTHPARVLAECEAKRRIVSWASDGEGEFHWATVLGPLASVYADHPDYREEWRP